MLTSPWLHTALGGLITGLVAWAVYVRSARDLRCEAAELRHLTEILVGGMERAGWVTVTRNAQGRLVQLIILHGAGTAPAATGHGTGHVRPPEGS
jgi:poly(3-hydroxybutyrate) depolymerase